MVCPAGSTFPPRPATHSAMRFVLNPAGRSRSKAKGRLRPISFIANKAAHTLFGFLRLFDDRFISVFERRFYTDRTIGMQRRRSVFGSRRGPLLARLVRHALNRDNLLEGPLRDRIADVGTLGCQGQVSLRVFGRL